MLNVAVVFAQSGLDYFTLELDGHYYDFLACSLVYQLGLDLLLNGIMVVLRLLLGNLLAFVIRRLFFLFLEVSQVLLTPASGQTAALDGRNRFWLGVGFDFSLARRWLVLDRLLLGLLASKAGLQFLRLLYFLFDLVLLA
jgi:hypothetical protein